MCRVDWCSRKAAVSGNGYCRRHYDQMRKYGRILDARSTHDPNRYIVRGDVSEILITDRYDRYVCSTTVDTEDLERLLPYRWTSNGNGYIRTFVKTKPLYMHRFLLGAALGMDVDHINNDRLDNRKANLRQVTHIENCNNRAGNRGTVKKINGRKLKKPYAAVVVAYGKRSHLGYFKTERDAKDAIGNFMRDRYQ